MRELSTKLDEPGLDVVTAFYGDGMTTIAAPAQDAPLDEIDRQISLLQQVETETAAIERIRKTERLIGRLESVQLWDTTRLQIQRLEREAREKIPKAKRGKGLGAEVALARSVSPARGKQHLELAGTLSQDMCHTSDALAAGRIRAEHAQAVAKETSELSALHRRKVDAAMKDRYGTAGPRELANEAKAHAQRLDPRSAAKRFAAAKDHRRITTQPAGDGMAKLIAIGPTADIVAAEQSLRQWAKTQVAKGKTQDKDGNKRTRDQLMFDELLCRIAGQSDAPAVKVEILLAMTPETLLAQGDDPAWLVGHGPIPAPVARGWLADPDLSVYLRRLFTDPQAHQILGLESQARRFPGGVRKMVLVRDNTCRTPFCEAPIVDADHIVPHRDARASNWKNASGLCAACNQTKENRGWRHEGDASTLDVITPTRHRYTKRAGPLIPGAQPQQAPEPKPPDDDHVTDDAPPERLPPGPSP